MGERKGRYQGTPPNYVNPEPDWTLKGRTVVPSLYQESLGTSAQDSSTAVSECTWAKSRRERCEPRLAAARSRPLAVGIAAQEASQETTRPPRDRAQCLCSNARDTSPHGQACTPSREPTADCCACNTNMPSSLPAAPSPFNARHLHLRLRRRRRQCYPACR